MRAPKPRPDGLDTPATRKVIEWMSKLHVAASYANRAKVAAFRERQRT
jgi:hypothetical protein